MGGQMSTGNIIIRPAPSGIISMMDRLFFSSRYGQRFVLRFGTIQQTSENDTVYDPITVKAKKRLCVNVHEAAEILEVEKDKITRSESLHQQTKAK
ncbi:hypothetical protein CHS0354_019153 [Potamilus streckersoni]|uniref:Uncharacterized protein n=1 Tax=Potamilus streckersoni TaxID=2493646 RepID=A0AAE0W4U8_9BIVA|nr:hypothetical protein CHS0354_019153 [Potamilus streckersoni]